MRKIYIKPEIEIVMPVSTTIIATSFGIYPDIVGGEGSPESDYPYQW